MIRFASLLLCLLLLGITSQAAEIDIAGQVINKTTESPIVGAQVQLVRPDGEEGGGKVLATVRSGNGGSFEFPDQEVADDDLLIGRVLWQNYPYETPVFDGAKRLEQFNLNVNSQNITIDVFNSTVEPPDLQFMVHHLAITAADNGLKCIERIVVENPSNQTFIGLGPRQTSILLNLPDGAREVKLDPKVTGATLVKTADGYGVSKAITPAAYNNRNSIIVEYMMDWPSALPWQRKVNLSRQTQYPTFFFFVARETTDQDLIVTSPKLGEDATAPIPIDGEQQQRIVNAVGSPEGGDHALEPGDELEISIERPVPAMFWGFLALFVCLLLFLPLALIGAFRRRHAHSETEFEPEYEAADEAPYTEPYAEEVAEADLNSWEPASMPSVIAGTSTPDFAAAEFRSNADPQRVRILANDIARLDEAWEAGQVEEVEYQILRADKKQTLVRLLMTGR